MKRWGRARSRVTNYNLSLRLDSSKYSRPRLAVFFSGRKENIAASFEPAPDDAQASSSQAHTKKLPGGSLFICAWGRARTADPFLFREMLYQLSYPSMMWLYVADLYGCFGHFRTYPPLYLFLDLFQLNIALNTTVIDTILGPPESIHS